MTSSILAGERRFATARRSGMVVLGKVAVPKPLNLPSQRLENHGLDPSVEIVPKGTLGWGSRPSSSGSNPWGPSSLSPNADGGTGSPSGRPSSGSGTRPSTAGSERSQESSPSVWGQSSRPSSASGALNSNQTAPALLRPRSADTRPGSSQLSRFAEPSSDNSVAWGPTGGSDKLGLGSSKNDGFSLSSGDFPTLGSERDNCEKSNDSKDQGSYARPGSSSSRAASGKGDVSVNEKVESGTVNTWKRDDPPHAEDVVQSDVDKWQAETQPYLPPQHFDAWRGPPVNPPGVWYRGPPQGPPYGTPLGPGGFPVESFYYHPQRPVGSANSQQGVLPSGTGLQGHQPNSRDIHRPQIPDAYLHPGMPLRPNFYPGPMAHEGYYGPPMGYSNSNEQNRPFMGMAARPSVYNNQYRGENAQDLGNNNARPSVRRSDQGHMESGHHPHNTRGPSYKVLTKHHTESEGKWVEDRRANAAPYIEKGYHPKASLDKNKWELEDERSGIHSGRTLDEDGRSKGYNNHVSHRDSTVAVFPENRVMEKAVVDGSVNKSDTTAVFPENPVIEKAVLNKSETAAVSVPGESLASSKDPMLIQKIEGLNAKARSSGSNNQNPRVQEANARTNSYASEVGKGAAYYDRTHTSVNRIPSTHDVDGYTVNKPLQSPVSGGTSNSRRGGQGTHERLDVRGKSFYKQDAEGHGKNRPLAMEPNPEVSSVILNDNVRGGKPLKPEAFAEKSGTNGHEKGDTESLKTMDSAAQRTKTREIAKQRAKKLQKDEEDRIREQKEKARAKLEELDQRAQVMDAPGVQNTSPRNPVQIDQEKPQMESKTETLSPAFESGNIVVGEFTVLSRDMLLATSQTTNLGSAVLFGQSSAQINQKDDILTEKPVQISPTEAPKSEIVETSDSASINLKNQSNQPKNSNVAASSPAHYSKPNRSNRNKHKLDKPPSSAEEKGTSAKPSQETRVSETSEMKDTRSVQTHDQRHPFPREEVGGKGNGQWNSRHMPRQQHGKKMEKLQSNDGLVWAPVRSNQNKAADVTDGTASTALPDVVAPSDGVSQKDTKGKRVEMERYVPKPIAKELAQQGSSQSSVNQTTSDNVRGTPVTENAGSNSTGETRIADGKRNNKPSKAHGLWRQRGLVESSAPGTDSQNASFSTNVDGSSKLDSTFSGAEQKASHDSGDGWNTMDDSGSAVVKDREVSGRGNRHQPKAHRNMGNAQRFSHRNGDDNRNFLQPRVPDIGHTETQGTGQRRSSQWQPKSQAYSAPAPAPAPAQSEYESRPREAQNSVVTDHRKVTREVQPDSEATDAAGDQGARRERQAQATTRYKGRPRYPNQHHDNTLVAPPSSQASGDSQRIPFGSRENVVQSNRFDALVDESYEDQISVGQDDGKQHQERQGPDSQYDDRSRNFEGQRDGGYKDRSHGQGRRGGGNYRGATARSDSGYNN